VGHAREHGDAAVPELDQMLGRGQPAGPVGDADARDVVRDDERIDEDERHAGDGQRAALRRRDRGGDHDRALPARGGDALHPRRRAVRGTHREHQLEALLLRRLAHAPDHLERVGVLERVDDQVDAAARGGVRGVGAARSGAPHVGVLVQQVLDP
jgi:hypothetical protein